MAGFSPAFGYLSDHSDTDKIKGVADAEDEESDASIMAIKKPAKSAVHLFVLYFLCLDVVSHVSNNRRKKGQVGVQSLGKVNGGNKGYV